jgi:hypothetical protein
LAVEMREKKESLKWICYSYNDERAEEKKILLDE